MGGACHWHGRAWHGRAPVVGQLLHGKRNQRSLTRTLSKETCCGVSSSQRSWRSVLATDHNGRPQSTKLRMLAARKSMPQGIISSDHNNRLPVPPLFQTLCLQSGVAVPPLSLQMSCNNKMLSSDPKDNYQ